MPSSSRIIFAEQIDEVEPFAIGRLQAGTGVGRGPRPAMASTSSYEARLKAAFEDGFRRGAADAGRRLARQRSDEEAGLGGTLAIRLDALTEGYAREIEALEGATADRVVALAIELARRVAGDTLSTQPQAMVAIAREALAALVDTQSTPTLRLHPVDLDAVQAQLAPALARRRIELQADPTITPGGCLLVSAGGAVDATLESRWARAMAAIGREPGEPPAVVPRSAAEAGAQADPRPYPVAMPAEDAGADDLSGDGTSALPRRAETVPTR